MKNFATLSAAVVLSLCALFAPVAAVAQEAQPRKAALTPTRYVAVTIDDLPVVQTFGDYARRLDTTRRLVASVKAYGVPAVGFVNENKLMRDDSPHRDEVALLRHWLDAGLELGNHTYSHPDLHSTPLEQFKQEVIRGEEVTRALLKKRGQTLRYFRHPFLHTGRDLETKREFESFLAARGYRVAPVTHDNSEWIFARAYDNAASRRDREMLKRIGLEYVDYMARRFDYFEKQSVALFGYEVRKILLIHANALNADYFDDLARMMKSRGYKFITLEEALADKAYGSPDTYAGPGGITWLHRWAITKGVPKTFFAGEPRTAAFVLKQAGLESE